MFLKEKVCKLTDLSFDTYLENVLKLTKGNKKWQPTVQYAIHIVKDENGNLDQERAAYLIARSSLKGQNLFKGYLLFKYLMIILKLKTKYLLRLLILIKRIINLSMNY